MNLSKEILRNLVKKDNKKGVESMNTINKLVFKGSVFLGTLLLVWTAQAEKPELKICTGGAKGTYAKVGQYIKDGLSEVADVQVIHTGGTKDNFQKMQANKCHMAVVQSDGLLWANGGDSPLDVSVVNLLSDNDYENGLYLEYVHLLCPRDKDKKRGIGGNYDTSDDITTLSHILKATEHWDEDSSNPNMKRPIILTGSSGSGAELTASLIQKLETDFEPLSFKSFPRPKKSNPSVSLNQLAYQFAKKGKRKDPNKNHCSMFVQKPPVSWLQKASTKQRDYEQMKLIGIEDGTLNNKSDFKDARGNSVRIYRFVNFEGDVYENFRDGDVETIAVKALFVAEENALDDFDMNHPEVVDKLDEVLAEAAKLRGSF